jgi:hypothetical protein
VADTWGGGASYVDSVLGAEDGWGYSHPNAQRTRVGGPGFADRTRLEVLKPTLRKQPSTRDEFRQPSHGLRSAIGPNFG